MKRRSFLKATALSAFQLYVQGCRRGLRTPSAEDLRVGQHGESPGFGPLVQRPGRLLDISDGLRYVILQRGGDQMSDGHRMPYQPDGMACFVDDKGRYVLLRNHEIGDRKFLEKYSLTMNPYSGGEIPTPRVSGLHFGGVSRLVVDPRQLADDLKNFSGARSTALERSHMVLAGTDCNCAGGVVPEGWVSCEESSTPGHGFAYLTQPGDEVLMEPRPIRSWGRLHREAIALDPETGVVYMTEDRADGCLYRHLPTNSQEPMGEGRLQALTIPGLPHTDPYPEPHQGTSPPEIWHDGQRWEAVWVDVLDPLASEKACRVQAASAGATAFNRGEGIAWSTKGLWFTASTGGPLKGGQIFRYIPDPRDRDRGVLTLELEVRDRTRLSCPDNIALAPWGDLIMAEDNYDSRFGASHQYLRGMTPEGRVYNLARNGDNQPQSEDPGAEFAGVCFSPDGRYLFVNLQTPEHLTIAMTGPWGK